MPRAACAAAQSIDKAMRRRWLTSHPGFSRLDALPAHRVAERQALELRDMVKAKPGYEANRARISLALSEFTVPLLSNIYRAFEGDMVAAIVLGEIAHRNVEEWLAEQGNPEELLHDPSQRTAVMRPCNALSIAEACGLPRETVRRKVVNLIEQGYVFRSDDGYLYLTQNVGDGFEDMTAKLVEDLLITARRLEELLADRPTRLGPLRLG